MAPGEPVISRRNLWCFVGAMVLLFTASTWPIHQIGEDYLYSVHMVQHMLLTYVLPPLVLLATPEWLMRVLIGNGRTYRAVAFLTRPVVAAVLYNLVVMLLHVPGVVNNATTSAPLHYLLHVLVVTTALLMWAPVVGPFHELQMKPGGKMVYLFLQGVVPTVPAMWLSMAEGPVYHHYGDQPVRVWGISAMDDQQIAGADHEDRRRAPVHVGDHGVSVLHPLRAKEQPEDSTADVRRRSPRPRRDHPLTYEQLTDGLRRD